MLILRGSPALSPFRIQKLLQDLNGAGTATLIDGPRHWKLVRGFRHLHLEPGHHVDGPARRRKGTTAGAQTEEGSVTGIAQPEQQQRVLGQFALDAAILRHHRSKLRFSGHAAKR